MIRAGAALLRSPGGGGKDGGEGREGEGWRGRKTRKRKGRAAGEGDEEEKGGLWGERRNMRVV